MGDTALVAIRSRLGALARRRRTEPGPRFGSSDRRLDGLGDRRDGEATDRESAAPQGTAWSPPSDAATDGCAEPDSAAFAAAGLRLETPRARAFAALLCQAATEERRSGDGGWTGRTVDQVVYAVALADLVGIVDDLGLGRLTPAGEAFDAGSATALRTLLIHLLRDRLQDALRLQAGLPAFWPAEAAASRTDQATTESSGAADAATARQFAA